MPTPESPPKESSLRLHRVVLVPAYNEARFIGSVVLQARQHAAMVIVVDDGSQDDTARIARDAGAILVQHETNRGKATALNSGIFYIRTMAKEALEKVQAVVIMDGDGQHHANDIPILTTPIFAGEADLVIGSRFLEVKSTIPRWRIFGQHALTAATNLGSGFRVTDSQSGFRALSLPALAKLDFGSEGFSVESEMQFLVQEQNLRLREVPIHVTYDDTLKRNPVTQALHVINGIFTMIGQYRPLLFFGGAGTVLLLVGIGWGGLVVSRFYDTGQLAAGYAMICVLLSVLGMILISTGFMLHSIRALLLSLLHKKE
ncbi:MAG: glycosyltransferase family 2 protein [Anaerolineales bacterium]|nr:glycosyltransferase family 2 protein [Anaerolineales bacterium]